MSKAEGKADSNRVQVGRTRSHQIQPKIQVDHTGSKWIKVNHGMPAGRRRSQERAGDSTGLPCNRARRSDPT